MTGPDVLSGDLQLYQKPREACLGPLWIQWPWTVIFRSSEKRSASRHFQSEWQSLFLVVKKWMQHLKDLLPCWLPLRYTRWKLAKIAKKDHVSWVIPKKKNKWNVIACDPKGSIILLSSSWWSVSKSWAAWPYLEIRRMPPPFTKSVHQKSM